MKRIAIVFILSLAGSGFVQAGEKDIALFFSSNASFYTTAAAGIKKKLSDIKGYSVQEYSLTDLDSVHAIQKARPCLIMTIGTKATDIAIRQFPSVPTIFCMVIDPRYPSATVTGVSLDIQPRPQFELLKILFPAARKIGVLYALPAAKNTVERARIDARDLNVEIVPFKVDSVADVYSAIRFLGKQVDVLWMIPDTTVYTPQATQDMLLYCLREKIPVIGLSPAYVKAGALFSLSCDYEDIGRQSGDIALKVLSGISPGRIPVAGPALIDTSINTITAERLGITIPEKVLKNARYVYR